ncbi:MAG: DUF4433 domain-containing protein [Gammaproteobacteria bacterium]
MQKLSEHFRNHGVTHLFYMTSRKNLDSILEHGILCRIRAEELQHQTGREFADISNKYVQKRREKYIWDVPLFFADNTSMLYTVCKKHRDLILLEISTESANCDGVQFSDGNVAAAESGRTEIYDSPEDLKKLNWDILLSSCRARWGDWKRIRQAEVLIPENCPATYIQGVYFQPRLPEELRAKLREILDNSPHEIFLESTLTPGGIPVGNKPQPKFLV